MTTEQSKTLDALQTAIQMEIDGKAYYEKMSQLAGNEHGAKLFQALAREEDYHRQKFEEIYRAVQAERGWPVVEPRHGSQPEMQTVFASATAGLKEKVKFPESELEAVRKAMDMENKTFDFYKRQAGEAIFEAEKKYYEALSGEERTHYLALADYYEYMQNPAGYFTMKERQSLDGG